jgi:hypothetical protein
LNRLLDGGGGLGGQRETSRDFEGSGLGAH